MGSYSKHAVFRGSLYLYELVRSRIYLFYSFFYVSYAIKKKKIYINLFIYIKIGNLTTNSTSYTFSAPPKTDISHHYKNFI